MNISTLESGHPIVSERLTISTDRMSQYLTVVGDDTDVYHMEGLAPPVGVAALMMSAVMRAVDLPAGAVHTSQEFEFVGPVQLGAELDCGATVAQNSVRRGIRFLVLQIVGNIDAQPVISGRISIAISGKEQNE